MEAVTEKVKRQVKEIRRELILIGNIVGNALPQHHSKTKAGEEVIFSSNYAILLGFLCFISSLKAPMNSVSPTVHCWAEMCSFLM